MNEATPPHAPDAEAAVLGSILLDHTRVLEVCMEQQLTAAAFYVIPNRLIYAAMLDLYSHDKAVNALTVADALHMDGHDDTCGGLAALNAMIDATPTAAHAEHYVDIVKQKHLLRGIIDVASNAIVKAGGAVDGERLRAETEMALEHLGTEDVIESIDAVWAGIAQKVYEAEEGKVSQIGIPFGIDHFDRVMCGLRAGGVYFLTGEKGCGKTTIACNIIVQQLFRASKTAVLSLEMSTEQMLERMAGSVMNCSLTNVIRGKEAPADGKLSKAGTLLTAGNLIIDSRTDHLDGFVAKMRKWKRQGVQLVVVDYIQRLRAGRAGQAQDLFAETTEISRTVTRVAKVLQLPVLCVSMESSGGLYGSRQLDYDAYGTLSVRRRGEDCGPPDYDQVVDVWVDKNRFGPSHISLPLRIVGRTGAVESVQAGEIVPEEGA